MAMSGSWKVKRAFCCLAPEPKWRGPLWRISVFACKKSCFAAQDDCLSPAKCWDGEWQEFTWSRGEARKQAKLFCSPLPLTSPSSPLTASPPLARLAAAPRTCRFGPFVCVVLSWEEVPSRLTLRKWFQSVLV